MTKWLIHLLLTAKHHCGTSVIFQLFCAKTILFLTMITIYSMKQTNKNYRLLVFQFLTIYFRKCVFTKINTTYFRLCVLKKINTSTFHDGVILILPLLVKKNHQNRTRVDFVIMFYKNVVLYEIYSKILQ
jgi:hypothetical protein